LTGGSVIDRDGNFVEPTVVEISHDAEVVREELFGPVLYVFKIKVCHVDTIICRFVPLCSIRNIP
jgi:aldehyde dehydrogenase family 7 protein A1